jgi:hypothetical protein
MRGPGWLAVILIQVIFGFEWLRAGWEKIEGGVFVPNLPKTFAAFADKNPYPWMKSFLTGAATANATLFGQLVQWGELLAGIALILGAAYSLYVALSGEVNPLLVRVEEVLVALALLGGMIMNAVFWFAAAHMNPSTDSVNFVMFFTQLVILGYHLRVLTLPEEQLKVVYAPAAAK